MGTQTLHKKRNTEASPKSRQRALPSPLSDNRRWLKVAEVARYLGLSQHHIYRMHRRGQLPSFKLPGLGVRVDRKALDAKIHSVKDARARAADMTWPD
jgi:excisionase family DNA binding protein